MIHAHARSDRRRRPLRATALAATIVALGAVLVAPETAGAAPIQLADPVVGISPSCGTGADIGVAGTIPSYNSSDTYQLRVFKQDVPNAIKQVTLAPGAAGGYATELDVSPGISPALRIELWQFHTVIVIGIAPRARAAAPEVTETLLGSSWYENGCPKVGPDEIRMQGNAAGPTTLKVTVSGFAAGTVKIDIPGRTPSPDFITTTGRGEVTQSITIDTPLPCGGETQYLTASQTSTVPGLPERRDTARLRAYCPTVTADPTRLTDTHLPSPVKLDGLGWYSFGEIHLWIDGVRVPGVTGVGGYGQWRATPTFPAMDCLTHKITAAQFREPPEPLPDVDFAPGTRLKAVAPVPPGDLADAWMVVEIPWEVSCSDADLDVTPALQVETPGEVGIDLHIRDFRRDVPIMLSLPGTVLTPARIVQNDPSDGDRPTITLDHQPPCGANTLTATQPQQDPALPPKVATAVIHVLCPRLTGTPDTLPEVNLPDPVAIGGEGWIPTLGAVVLWDGKPLTKTVVTSTGQLKDSVEIPRTDCGLHRLEVVQEVNSDTKIPKPLPRADRELKLVAVTPITVACQTPQVLVQPQVLATKPGPQKLDVQLSGFLQGLSTGLALPGTVLDPATIMPTRIDPGHATVTADKQPVCGQSTFTATQSTGGEFPKTRSAATPIHVFCPTFAPVTPTVLDTKLAGQVGMTGRSWVPNQQIQLVMDKRIVGTVAVDDKGTATGSPKLPRSACGKHELEAVQVTAVDATPASTHLPQLFEPFELRVKATLTVVCPPAALAVNPGVVIDGNTAEAAGVGFTPGRKVILEWTYDDGTRMGDACEATASAGGTFIVVCLVLPNTALGSRKLHAVEVVPPGDPVVARIADAPLLVVPGSMDRGDHSGGRFLERR